MPILKQAALTFAPRAWPWSLVACVSVAMLGPMPVMAETSAVLTYSPAKANGAGVNVAHRLEGPVEKGVPLNVVVVVTPASNVSRATVHFSVDEGIQLKESPQGEVPLEVNGATTFRLVVVPTADGLRYLNVFASQNGAVATTSIPIQIGKPQKKSAGGTLRKGADGERILSQPVK